MGKSEKWHWIVYGEDDGDVEYEEGEGPQRFQLVDETGGLILEGTRARGLDWDDWAVEVSDKHAAIIAAAAELLTACEAEETASAHASARGSITEYVALLDEAGKLRRAALSKAHSHG